MNTCYKIIPNIFISTFELLILFYSLLSLDIFNNNFYIQILILLRIIYYARYAFITKKYGIHYIFLKEISSLEFFDEFITFLGTLVINNPLIINRYTLYFMGKIGLIFLDYYQRIYFNKIEKLQ